jgi:hypothetical protein
MAKHALLEMQPQHDANDVRASWTASGKDVNILVHVLSHFLTLRSPADIIYYRV